MHSTFLSHFAPEVPSARHAHIESEGIKGAWTIIITPTTTERTQTGQWGFETRARQPSRKYDHVNYVRQSSTLYLPALFHPCSPGLQNESRIKPQVGHSDEGFRHSFRAGKTCRSNNGQTWNDSPAWTGLTRLHRLGGSTSSLRSVPP